jgi:MarR family transcriptional regulator, organic hydroperoxide resistance regulator
MKKEDNAFGFENAEESSGFLLWQLTNLWQREIKKSLEPFGLTHSQFVLLASIHWLTIQKRDVTQVLLSNHTKIDPMTTSTVLRTLQTKEFIKRQEHSTDTRAKTVALTATGTKTVKQAIKIVEKFDAHFFAKLKSNVATFNKNILLLLSE